LPEILANRPRIISILSSNRGVVGSETLLQLLAAAFQVQDLTIQVVLLRQNLLRFAIRVHRPHLQPVPLQALLACRQRITQNRKLAIQVVVANLGFVGTAPNALADIRRTDRVELVRCRFGIDVQKV
jgi:hypothetical protein